MHLVFWGAAGPMRHHRFNSNMTNEYDWAQDTAPSRQSDLTALRIIAVPAYQRTVPPIPSAGPGLGSRVPGPWSLIPWPLYLWLWLGPGQPSVGGCAFSHQLCAFSLRTDTCTKSMVRRSQMRLSCNVHHHQRPEIVHNRAIGSISTCQANPTASSPTQSKHFQARM